MLEKRRIWVEAEGLNSDVIENIYRDLFNYFIKAKLDNCYKPLCLINTKNIHIKQINS